MPTPNPSGLQYIRQEDLKDPPLTTLNRVLSFFFSSIAALQQASGSSTSAIALGGGDWTPYRPIATASATMTVSGVTVFSAVFQKELKRVSVLLDVSVVLGGTPSNTVYLTLPVGPGGSQFLLALNGSGYYDSADSFSCQCVIQSGKIAIRRFDASNFVAGAVEFAISGFYQI